MSHNPNSEHVDAMLHVPVDVGGRTRDIRLAIRTAGDVMPDVREPHRRVAHDVPYLVLDAIETIDGDVPGLGDANEICSNGHALTTVIAARNRVWSTLQMRGRLHALCPHCQQHESSFDLSTFALVLRTPPPALVDGNGLYPQAPALADRRPHGRRLAEVPTTTRLRAVLPSGSLGLEPRSDEAVLRDLDGQTDGAIELLQQAWARWAPHDRVPSAEHAHWHRGSPGFRATIRLAIALSTVDGDDDVTPERVEGLSIGDFFFLDACHFFTHSVDQPRADALVVTCESCGGDYLPLR